MPVSLQQTDFDPPACTPFSITIIQVYAPTSGHDDSEVDHFYQQLQETIDQTPKKDILEIIFLFFSKESKSEENCFLFLGGKGKGGLEI